MMYEKQNYFFYWKNDLVKLQLSSTILLQENKIEGIQMKKLLLVPMVLILIIFSLYLENIDGMDSSTKGKITQEIQLEEAILDIYNTKNEINTSIELNETIEEKFSVEIKGDLNTTKETVITLNAVVKNAKKLDACNFFWYEKEELIYLGSILQKAFDKGEHNITLVVRDANGEETNTSVIVRAYNYYSVTSLNYDAHYGHLLYTQRVITNHKGQDVFDDNGIYSKSFFTYSEDGYLVERRVEYYLYPEENRKTEFSYDDKGNRLTSQIFNAEGKSIEYNLMVYDANSTLLEIKFGTSPDDINDNYVYGIINDDTSVDASTTYTEDIKVPEDIVRMNDNGQIIYEERYYGDMKVLKRMTYNEENKLIKSQKSLESSYEESSSITDYDIKGNAINIEKKYEVKGQTPCHYRSENTYTDVGQVKSSVSTLLGGECHYIDEIKRVFHYDKEGRVINVKSSTDDGDIENAYTTLEVIKEYINEIDI